MLTLLLMLKKLKMHKFYIRIDCDNVGDKIEFSLYNHDPKSAQDISDSIKENIKWLIEKVRNKLDGELLLLGSDDILYSTDKDHFNLNELENIRQEFADRMNITLSIGVGKSITDAMVNMKIAKISGKNTIVVK